MHALKGISKRGIVPPPVSSPRNPKQAVYLDMLRAPKPYVVVASGHAGCGKSMLATQVGIEKLRAGDVEKVIITRPAVSVDEQHGFLPGTLEQKMDPWTRPVFDVIEKHFAPEEIQKLMKHRVLEICPLGFMRGRTFENAWIICDEAQNCTPNQMLMLLTRMGENSKIVVTGDPFQHDRGFESNGLKDLVDKLDEVASGNNNYLRSIQFEETDVERHEAIPFILSMYSSSR